MKVPFVDLHAQYLKHRASIDNAINAVIEDTAFIGGKYVRSFERDYAEKYCVRHCIACANGTDAIYIALKMLGVGPGDEVITTAHSWISTSETISQTGATPVFVDVDDYFCLDVAALESARTSRTRAVVPVHLFGQAAAVERVQQFCEKYNLYMIEDCAQAHFARRHDRLVGTFGIAATFSFYPGKNLGAYGDAGAIVTNDDELAKRCRMYANHGALVKHEHQMEGINSRMDGLQAAILGAKLPHIDAWTRKRQRVAALYDDSLRHVSHVRIPRVSPGSTHVYHLYVILCERRDALRAHLAECGIETAVHYPTALPLLPAYGYLHKKPSDYPRAADNQQRMLSLPVYPEMSDEMIEYVVRSIRDFYSQPV